MKKWWIWIWILPILWICLQLNRLDVSENQYQLMDGKADLRNHDFHQKMVSFSILPSDVARPIFLRFAPQGQEKICLLYRQGGPEELFLNGQRLCLKQSPFHYQAVSILAGENLRISGKFDPVSTFRFEVMSESMYRQRKIWFQFLNGGIQGALLLLFIFTARDAWRGKKAFFLAAYGIMIFLLLCYFSGEGFYFDVRLMVFLWILLFALIEEKRTQIKLKQMAILLLMPLTYMLFLTKIISFELAFFIFILTACTFRLLRWWQGDEKNPKEMVSLFSVLLFAVFFSFISKGIWIQQVYLGWMQMLAMLFLYRGEGFLAREDSLAKVHPAPKDGLYERMQGEKENLEQKLKQREAELEHKLNLLRDEVASRLYYEAKLQKNQIEIQNINKALYESSTKDGLTQMFNRKRIEDILQNEMSRAGRYGHPLVVGMLDLDDFKSINDRYGHALGDQVLCKLAEVLGRNLRTVDYYGRYGGEEFLVVLPETDLEDGAQVLNRVLKDMGAQVFSEAPDLEVTFSAGVAMYQKEEAMGMFIQRADRKLYRAKEKGKNRVIYED